MTVSINHRCGPAYVPNEDALRAIHEWEAELQPHAEAEGFNLSVYTGSYFAEYGYVSASACPVGNVSEWYARERHPMDLHERTRERVAHLMDQQRRRT